MAGQLAEPSTRPQPPGRESFTRFVPLTTRWSDNDVYGHINNAAYFTFFDAAVNSLLVDAGLLHPATSEVIALVVENSCAFFSSLSFPEAVEIGVVVERLGRTSVRYKVAAFGRGAGVASAAGRFTHVYVDRATRQPIPVPDGHRKLLESLRPALPPTPRALPRAEPFLP
jgi:acyl-CoA thioester hydrolase